MLWAALVLLVIAWFRERTRSWYADHGISRDRRANRLLARRR